MTDIGVHLKLPPRRITHHLVAEIAPLTFVKFAVAVWLDGDYENAPAWDGLNYIGREIGEIKLVNALIMDMRNHPGERGAP